MIKIENLTKRYGKIMGINNITFQVKEGEILGFLGPNGAGKSTLMNIITGYKSPTKGSVLINGIDISKMPIEAKKNIGYLPEIPPLYPELSVMAYLRFVCGLKGIKKSLRTEHILEIIEKVNITHVKNRLIKNLSKGYKQRVGIAQALIGNPKIIILDEPTVGLDPKQIIEIRHLIKSLKKKHTVMISSHVLSEVSAVCDRVVIINKGEIVAIDTPENLSEKLLATSQFILKIKGDSGIAMNILNTIDGIISVEIQNQIRTHDAITSFIVDTTKEADILETVFYKLANNHLPIYGLKVMDLSLEEIFLQLINEQEDTEKELI